MALAGLAIGMINSSVAGELALIVETRYLSDFGNIFSILDMTLCLSFILGIGDRLI